jgi:hypothetical protein
VLKSVQDTAPPPHTTADDIIAKADRIRGRRVVAAVAGGMVACIAVTATAVAGLGAPGTSGLPAAAPQATSSAQPMPSAAAPVSSAAPIQPTDFSTTLADYRVGSYKIGPAGQVAPGYQEIPVYRDGQTWSAQDGTRYPLTQATITTYRPGVYDPATFGGVGDVTLVIGESYPVTVNGRSGIGRDMIYLSPVEAGKKYIRASLAWEYAPNAWATLVPGYHTSDLSRADAAKIAAGLTTGSRRELRVPYRFGFLPDGWRPVAVTQNGAKISSELSKVFLHKGPLTESAAAKIDEVFPHSAVVTVSKGDLKDDSIRGKNGLHCSTSLGSCAIVQGDYVVSVAALSPGLPGADLRRIAQGLHLLDLTDQKTWVPLPAGG